MELLSTVNGIRLTDVEDIKKINVAFTAIKTKGGELAPQEIGEVTKIADGTAGFATISPQFLKEITVVIPVNGNVLSVVMKKVTPDKYQPLGIPQPCHELLNQLREAL
jgi:hypothetical protein